MALSIREDRTTKKSDGTKRSPMRANPLQNPGQSLDEKIERSSDENATPYLYVSAQLFLWG